MQGWETNSTRTWDIGEDVVAELRKMTDLDDVDQDRIEPAFDPLEFQERHLNPTLEAF